MQFEPRRRTVPSNSDAGSRKTESRAYYLTVSVSFGWENQEVKRGNWENDRELWPNIGRWLYNPLEQHTWNVEPSYFYEECREWSLECMR